MRKERFPAVILFIFTLILSFKLSPFLTGIGHDKQVFMYGAMTIWKGQVPYKTFFDHKPPLIFLLLAVAWPFKAWGYFFLGVLTKWAATLFSYNAAKAFSLSNAWLYPVIFLVCILTPFILMDGLLTREYAACFLLILFSAILIYPGRKYIAVGLLCGLVFHTQQEELILAFPFVMYHVFYKSHTNFCISWSIVFQRCLGMAVGFMIVTAPLLMWLAMNESLVDYWNQAFLFNLTEYTSRMSWLYKIKVTLNILFHSRFLFLVLPMLIMHGFCILRKVNGGLHFASFSTIILGLYIKTFAGRIADSAAMYHYFLTFSAVVSIAAIILAKEIETYFLRQYLKSLSVVFSVGLFFLMWKNAFPSFWNMRESALDIEIRQLTQNIQDIKNKDGQIYVMGHTPFLALNNNLNALAPTKWIYTSQYSQNLSGFDAEGNVIKEIIAGLEKNRTKYVVDFHLLNPVHRPAFQQPWETYLKSHYTEVYRKKDYILFKRSPVERP
jgi:hypothetical protein